MEFYNYLKDLFGFPNRHNSFRDDRPGYRDDFNENHNRQYSSPEESDRMGFNIFSDPLEMHRYFEHQMNEMLKSFGFQDHGSFFGGSFNLPAIDGSNEETENATPEQDSGSLRDHYLKPGYEKESQNNKLDRTDSDIDGRLNIGDLDSVFKGRQTQITPRVQFYGQSVSTRTIQNTDGTMETHRTIKNHDGSEETTITRKQGDREYTVIKRKDKNGQEETIENLVNMDENDVNKFFKDDLRPDAPNTPYNWFNFDKYFK